MFEIDIQLTGTEANTPAAARLFEELTGERLREVTGWFFETTVLGNGHYADFLAKMARKAAHRSGAKGYVAFRSLSPGRPKKEDESRESLIGHVT